MSNTPYFVQKANSGLPSGQLSSATVNLTGQGAAHMNLVSIAYANWSSTNITASVTSVTSSNGNTYARCTTLSQFVVDGSQGPGAGSIQSFYGAAIKAGNETVTVNLSGPVDALVVTVAEYSLPSATPLRAAGNTPNQSGGTSNTLNPSPVPVSGANSWKGDLIIGIGVAWDGPVAVGTGFTSRETIRATYLEDSQSDTGGVATATATAPSTHGSIGQTITFATPVSVATINYFVQKANSGSPVHSASLQVTLNTQTAGNLNFLVVGSGNFSNTTIAGSVTGITSSAGNNYVAATTPSTWTSQKSPNSAGQVQSYYAPNIKAGTDTVTVTLSNAVDAFWVALYEYAITGTTPFGSAGITPPYVWPDTGVAPYTVAIPVSGSVGYNGDFVIGIGSCNDGLSAVGAGYSLRDSVGAYYVEEFNNYAARIATARGTAASQNGSIGQTIVFRTPQTVVPQNPTSGEVLLVCDLTASNDTWGAVTNLADGNSWTWWSTDPGQQWARMDALVPVKVTRIRFSVIAGNEDNIIGATFQASNDPTFSSGIRTLYTVPARPTVGTLMNEVIINSDTAYRYYQWNSVQYTGLADLDIYVTAANSTGSIVTPGDVAMSPSTGNFDMPVCITLSLLNPSPIYYTLDGTVPSASSHLYTGPFVVSSSCTLSAVGIYQGNNGRVLSRPIHIGKTEVSVDDIYDSRNYKLWALNGHTIYDPVSGYWYRYGLTADTPIYYNYGYSGNTVYRSADLRNWSFRGMILPPPAGTADGTTNIRYHVGIHVGYNRNTHKYVCWADSYDIYPNGSAWSAGKTVWTSNAPEGPFNMVNTFTSFPGTTISGQAVQGDSFLFVDTDGVTAYFYTTCGAVDGQINNTLYCAQLSSDWLSFGNSAHYPWNSFSGGQREAPCMIHVGNTYFLMHSGTAGFASSDCRYSTSANPLGPFSGNTLPFQPAPAGGPDYNTSFNTQVWQITPLPGRQGGYIYNGDRYDTIQAGNIYQVRMTNWKRIRLPVIFSGNTMTINWLDAWSFDDQMPSVSAPQAPSNVFIFSDGTAYWTHNDPMAVQYFVDAAPTDSFTTGVSTFAVPLGQTHVSGLPYAPVYRIRAKNAFGTSFSPYAVADEPPLGVISINPPFLPITFPPGPPTVPVFEDGPSKFVPYNGQMQHSKINVAIPIPGTGIRPKWEDGPGPADPNLSNINIQASATGYGAVGRGTIGVGVPMMITASGDAVPAGSEEAPYQAPAPSAPAAATTLVDTPSGELLYGGVPGAPLHTIEEPKPTYMGSFYGQQSPLEQWWWNGTGQPTDDWVKHP